MCYSFYNNRRHHNDDPTVVTVFPVIILKTYHVFASLILQHYTG